MEAACRGARSRGGMTVGLLPGSDREDANGWVVLALPTGLGEARNALVAGAADAVVAIGGGWGTLSEIGFALRAGMPVLGVGTWELERGGAPVAGVRAVDDARDGGRRGAAARVPRLSTLSAQLRRRSAADTSAAPA